MRGYSLEKICYRVPINLAFMNNPKNLFSIVLFPYLKSTNHSHAISCKRSLDPVDNCLMKKSETAIKSFTTHTYK